MRKEVTTFYRMVNSPGHPLDPGGGIIPEHRLLLYKKIGPSSHPCHWCGRTLTWMPGQRMNRNALVVDHLDSVIQNNALENLVPTCQACNSARAQRIPDDEVFYIRGNGTRLRGVRRICEKCGTSFVIPNSGIGRGRGRFCSPSCARKSPRKRR